MREHDVLDNQYTWNPDSLTVADFLTMDNNELLNQLDATGLNNPRNIEMAHITYDIALLYHLTNDTDYAYKAALLLDKYADVFPDWPNSGFSTGRDNAYWSGWFHTDLNVARKLPSAYDLIYNSGAFEMIDTGTKDKVKDLFILIIQRDFANPLYIHNVCAGRALGIVIFGRALEANVGSEAFITKIEAIVGVK